MKAQDRKENQRAVALAYDPGRDDAPKVAAKGSGWMAEKIIQIAMENGIPIHEDPDLVSILSKFDLEQAIPPHLYEIVAEVLAFVYTLNDRRRRETFHAAHERKKGDR
ncbi:MAG: EscU/YscU/HrcU family type III secretion system export apparatus switch protein [Deltaproteobacteria bacterium]|nr:EscU/YscU/HrcU family type III secretion system export apparatus switch protein [Deltaproteobacteria bacterium]MBW2307918.1 EscU/YscU/HrcU family type III secretion system export apparatus switch protein [Deltaproteobacteria bacterium]